MPLSIMALSYVHPMVSSCVYLAGIEVKVGVTAALGIAEPSRAAAMTAGPVMPRAPVAPTLMANLP